MNGVKKYSRFHALLILAGLSCNLTFGYTTQHIDYAYNSHLSSFPAEPQPREEKPKLGGLWNLIKNLFAENPFKVRDLSERQLREFAHAAENVEMPEENVINTDFIDRLELFSGIGAHKRDHILHRLTTITKGNKTYNLLHTKVGEKRGRDMIAQPITDVNVLQQRAAFINELASNGTLLKRCEQQLKQFKENENLFLRFFQEDDLIETRLIDKLCWRFPGTTLLNKNTLGLEFGRRVSNLLTLVDMLSVPATLIISAYGGSKLGEKISNQPLPESIQKFNIAIGALFALPIERAILSEARIEKDVANCLQTYLIGMSSCVDSMKQLYNIVRSNTTLGQNQELFTPLEDLTKPSNRHSSAFNDLIGKLDTNTFRGNASFFSLTGRVLRAYKLTRTEGIMAEFSAALKVLGELDMYVAIAKKIKSQRNNPNAPFCFVNFIENSDKPYIKANNFWNLFVDPAKAVPNSIELGKGNPQNIILTGPNTGGKSTTMKALMINLLLAQTFGIACAQEMNVTPFANLDTYINITDYTGGGQSGLQAEVDRAKEVVRRIRSLPNNQFTFVILDEIFKATSPDQAEKLAHFFLKDLCTFDNCMFIDATHYKNLVALEQEDPKCKNYHMGALVDANNRITQYTYKLEEGPSTVQNAAQVAQDSDLWFS